MLCPYLLISINELLISIISFNDINKYGLNVKTAAHRFQTIPDTPNAFVKSDVRVLKGQGACSNNCTTCTCKNNEHRP